MIDLVEFNYLMPLIYQYLTTDGDSIHHLFSQDFSRDHFFSILHTNFLDNFFLEKIPVDFSSRILKNYFEFSKLFLGPFRSTVPKHSDFRRLKA